MIVTIIATLVICAGLVGLWVALTDDTADRIRTLPKRSYERALLTRENEC